MANTANMKKNLLNMIELSFYFKLIIAVSLSNVLTKIIENFVIYAMKIINVMEMTRNNIGNTGILKTFKANYSFLGNSTIIY